MNKRFALCVGINDYPGTGQDLRGCVNDAGDWGRLLTSEGYAVQTLLDAQATKAAILAGLRSLVAQARFADRIVFTYSGHGSWVPDRDGDEEDRRDEVLVAHDFRTGGLITDDELNEVFAERRFGVRVLVVSDSCNSGTLHRFVEAHTVVDAKPRFLAPSEFLSDEALVRAAVVAEEQPRGTSRTQTALLSGCADTEYSYDAFIDGRPRGAFTAHALATYKSGQSLAAWHKAIRQNLPNGEYPQTPQFQATSSQRRWSLS